MSHEPEFLRIDASTFQDWQGLLNLILGAFAYMDGVIDPPSSAVRLTVESLKEKAEVEIGYMALLDGVLVGCAFFRPEPPDYLYIGKLAVSEKAQGRGIGSRFLALAINEARARGLPQLRLETRVELTGNHERFGKWGFVKTAENAHAGFDRPTSIEMQRAV
ncbi:GNAT family N-acetyltransferase [Rhizobium sp. L1K21]|uniref:GNAT family N-acetyltransferase n=1 Tax=Rhizobium sp. L1K21 TaxID=2954933 RepID=UPI0020929419|nr:GNAT family N-acetyltransferase [Rhizobium sp. L1K21]MCO6184784.1 GNAT family N-acetyltransferase [Rhizobium sp. L1K21]